MNNLCDKSEFCMFSEDTKLLPEEDIKTYYELYCKGAHQYRCMRRIYMNLYKERPDKDLLPNGFSMR